MRIQNFGSWSPYMVKPGFNTLGLEYTVWEGDDEWTSPDEVLIERAKQELEHLGLAKAGEIQDGYVVRQAKAYPIYDDRYRANVDVLRTWLASGAAGDMGWMAETAAGCSATTTRTTRCSRRCSPWRTSSPARPTTCGR